MNHPALTDPLFIFDTHPIQYRTPVFQALSKRLNNFEVFFFDEKFDGKKWWFHEFNKIPDQKFAVPLQEGFPNQILGTKQRSWLNSLQRLRTLFISKKPGAVLMYGYYLPEHWLLWALCRQLKIPLIFVGETFQVGNGSIRKAIKKWLHPIFFSKVFRFIAIGKKTKEFYKTLGVPEERILSAKYCVDVSFFERDLSSAQSARKAIRQSLGVPEEAFVLLFVGRLFERKRPQDFLAIHRKLANESNVYSWMIGNGPLESQLRTESANLERFSMLGFKNQNELKDFYAAADLLIVPSEYETWGLVVNEALACGLPAAVTTHCGVSGDLILNGKTGFVCPPGDIDSFAKAVRTLLLQPELHTQMSLEGKVKVKKEYGIEQFAEALYQAYQDALSAKGFRKKPY